MDILDLILWSQKRQRQAAAKGKGGVSWSSYWTTRTPSALVLTVLSPTSIKLDWTNAGAADYDGHSVEVSTDGVDFTEVDTVAVGTNTFTDTGLTGATLYYYRVRAYKDINYSEYCTIESEETIYLPTEIANLFLWHDASQITGKNDNDVISSFTDFSGNNHHLVQATGGLQPLYKTNIQNSKPSVRFDGSDDFVQKYGGSAQPTQPYTTFLVVKRLSGTDTKSPFGFGGEGAIYFVNDTLLRLSSGTGLDINPAPSLLNNPVIISAVSNGASSVLSINGGYTVTGNSGTGTGDRTTLGDYSSTGSTRINADIFDHLTYTGALDATTRRRIEKYLAWKYAIELEPI